MIIWLENLFIWKMDLHLMKLQKLWINLLIICGLEPIAFHKDTEEKFNLWEPYPNRHPSLPLTPPNTFKDVVYDGRPDLSEDVTLIANYPTMVVTSNLGKA